MAKAVLRARVALAGGSAPGTGRAREEENGVTGQRMRSLRSMDKIRQVGQRSAGRLSLGLGLTAIVLASGWTIAQLLWGDSFWDALLAGPIASLLIGIGVSINGYRQLKRTDPSQ